MNDNQKTKRKKIINTIVIIYCVVFTLFCLVKLIYKFSQGYETGIKKAEIQQIEQK